MNTLSFSYNWNNKLGNKAFTTIRLHNPRLYSVGSEHQIKIPKSPVTRTAKVIEVRHFLISDINEFVAFIDTGYNKDECVAILKRMYHASKVDWTTQKLDFVLLAYTDTMKNKQ